MLGISVSHKLAFGTKEFTKNAVLVDDWSQVAVTTTTAFDDISTTAAVVTGGHNNSNEDDDTSSIIQNTNNNSAASSALPSLRPRPKNVTFVPPARREIWSNLKMTMKQPDIWADIRDICRGA